MNNDLYFSNDFKRKREIGRKYALQKIKVRKRFLKGAVAFSVVTIMAGGVVKFIPSLFSKVEAKKDIIKNESYSMLISNGNHDDKKDFSEEKKHIFNNNEEVGQSDVDIIDSDIDEPVFIVGNDASDLVRDFLNTYIGSYLVSYSLDYGVDPNIMASICMTETSLDHEGCCPGGDRYSGYGVGYMQLESPSGQEVTAYNYNTGLYDTEYITMDNACDPIMNLKIGCMIMQNSINHFNGNQLLAIQSHNYGLGMTDSVLYTNYSDVDVILKDYSNVSWLDYMEDAHNNPLKYLPEWFESTYGASEYVACVLSHCPVKTASYKYDDSDITVDLTNGKVLEIMKLEDKVR